MRRRQNTTKHFTYTFTVNGERIFFGTKLMPRDYPEGKIPKELRKKFRTLQQEYPHGVLNTSLEWGPCDLLSD